MKPEVILFLPALAAGYLACIMLHEIGHLLAAWIIGWKPLAICMGFGKRKTLVRFGDLKVQLAHWPVGGLVEVVAFEPANFRRKYFAFAAAGPAATAAAILFLVAVLLRPSGTVIPRSWEGLIMPLLVLQAWMLVQNLWPIHIDTGKSMLPSDGLQMLQVLWLKDDQIPAILLAHASAYADSLLADGKVAEAKKLIAESLARWPVIPPSVARTMWIDRLIAHDRQGEANAACDELLKRDDASGESRIAILDSLACLPLFYGHRHLIPRALAWIGEALLIEPDRLALQGTKGSLLIESGEVEDGLCLIKEVRRTSTSENDQAICAYYLSLALFRMGETEKARRHLRQARADHPGCIVASRISDMISHPTVFDRWMRCGR